jgi:Ser/Thr protein kinase RdoA (MazF antagonist)
VSGPTLLEYLETRASWFATKKTLDDLRATMTAVGRWIRVFQSMNPGGDPVTVADLRQYVDIRLERLVRHAGRRFTEHDRRRVLEHIDALGAAIPEAELQQVTAHSDLSLGNVLVSGDRIVVLDFAMTRLDTRLYDLTKVALQLDLLRAKPQYSARMIHELTSALIEGFDPSLTVDRPLFRLVTLLHRVNHLTGLHVNRASLLASVYNSAVRRQHRRWLARELDLAVAAGCQ